MVFWYESVLLYIASYLIQTYGVDPSCECVVFQSYGLSEGIFHSPNYPAPYKPGINCILFTFVGDVNEIIEITFVDLDLRPRVMITNNHYTCKDRLRIFQNLDRAELNENLMYDVELCGNMSTLEDKKYYSRDRALVLELHSDPSSREKYKGFKGVFKFLDKSLFITDGTPGPGYGTPCTYHMQSENNQTSGDFFSPLYPQKYPRSSTCHYVYHGYENETVRVKFKSIRLPKQGTSCGDRGDYIKVYDGVTNSSNVIRTYCGNYNNEEIYSTGPYLMVVFVSSPGRERRGQGFAAEYEFQKHRRHENDASHLPHYTPGLTDCNKKIVSDRTTKSGTITSPHYSKAYQSTMTCEYEFHAQGLERVQLRFVEMNLHYTGGHPYEPYGCPSQDSIKVYVYIDDKEELLGEFCGKKIPPQLMSNGPRMKVVFKSKDSQKEPGALFKIEYNFRTDYGVLGDGDQDSRGECSFNFNRTKGSSGYFTSPNFNGHYPLGTVCNYSFNGNNGDMKERVNITFDYIQTYDSGCDENTDSDYISFSNYRSTDDRKMRRYCGSKAKYPSVVSDAAFFRVTFKSNNKYDANGFKAYYRFLQDETVTPMPTRQGSTNGSKSHHSGTYKQSVATLVTLLLLSINAVIFKDL